eukprot:123573_1
MLTWLLQLCLWILCYIPFYYGFQNLTLLFTLPLSTILFLILIYLYRYEQPQLYTQIHAYPHKYIAPFLSCALSFNPTPWLFNRYLETYIPVLIKVPLPFQTKQEIINVKGTNHHFDGQCSITWAPLTSKHITYPEMSPIIIVVPGLTGDINAKYCRRLMIAVHTIGWQAVIFNPRGRGGVAFKSPQAYSVGYTEDLRQVIKYIHNKYPNRMLFGVGFSLGANYLAKYMGEESTNALLNGAVCCAAPTDPIVCNAAIKKQPIMDRMLASLLKNILLKDEILELFKTRPMIECQKGISCTTLRQFDHYIIAPQFGFRSCTEYYRKSGAGYTLMDIAKPTLFLYAQNDITVPIDVFCPEDYDGNPYICAVITRFGSHSMSWLEGVFKFNSWQADITIQYIKAVFMLKCKDKFDKTNFSE